MMIALKRKHNYQKKSLCCQELTRNKFGDVPKVVFYVGPTYLFIHQLWGPNQLGHKSPYPIVLQSPNQLKSQI
jgi:hypothetical protein